MIKNVIRLSVVAMFIWEIFEDTGNNKITELRTILQRESQNS